MYAFALFIGMMWPAVAPSLIVPGMTFKQVDAILGKASVSVFTGPINGGHLIQMYPQWGITVCFGNDGVESVSRRNK